LRRLRTHGAWAAYGRVVRRCLLLILMGSWATLVGGLHVSRWGPEQHTNPLALLATYVKFDCWTILTILGVTSLWVAPVIGRSVRVRVGFLLGGLALHALATQVFYLDFMRGRPNFVEAALGTIGVPSREGGPLGFLVWAVPQLVGSFVYDLIVAVRPERSFRVLIGSGLVLVGVGYGLSCLSSFYPVAQGPRANASDYPDTQQPIKSPVLPQFRERSADEGAARLPYPPFVPRRRNDNRCGTTG
jgi:hypothetical protein